MAKLLHYYNEDTDAEYIVIDDGGSEEEWLEEGFKLLNAVELEDCPVTLPTNKAIWVRRQG